MLASVIALDSMLIVFAGASQRSRAGRPPKCGYGLPKWLSRLSWAKRIMVGREAQGTRLLATFPALPW